MTHPVLTLEKVRLSPLETDDRIDEIQSTFPTYLKRERAYTSLGNGDKRKVDEALATISSMRFDSMYSFKKVVASLLENAAPDLKVYIEIALDNAQKSLQIRRGVLVIYTGGTIGSAPKDSNDPDSPQVVKPWKELKATSPRLGSLGYPVDAISFIEPLDSCNVGPNHWYTMAKIIEEHYDEYEGFVILHGTDSMVYTASALSFMLLQLNKPVVITGAQVSGVAFPRNDSHQNMITAIMLANTKAHNNKLPPIPEVIIAFGSLISRGNRTKKMNVVEYQGFRSNNYPLLGTCGDHITLNKKYIRAISDAYLNLLDKLDTNVIILEVFPGIHKSKVLENILLDENLKGVVLKAYGSGNVPTDAPFLNLLDAFIRRGGIVVNTTSCPAGEVMMGLYETSQILLDLDILSGFDITPEAALCKLMVLLGNYPDDPSKVRRLMQQSIAGEQRLSLHLSEFNNPGQVTAEQSAELAKTVLMSSEEVERIETVMLRLKNANLQTGIQEYATISLFLDNAIKLDKNDSAYLCTFRRRKVPENALMQTEKGESLSFDLSAKKHFFVSKVGTGPIKGAQKIGFKLLLQGDENADLSWESAELAVYEADA